MGVVISLCLAILFAVIICLSFKCILLKRIIKKDREYYINTLSHDLRVSELAKLRGISLLNKEHGKNNELLNEIYESSKFSLEMITMLIDMYKYENKQTVLKFEVLNFSEIVMDTLKYVSEQASLKAIKIIYDISDDQVFADKVSIKEALMKLILTAINNSLKGNSIIIKAKTCGGKLLINITYEGISLSEEEYNRMFSGECSYSTVGNGIKMFMCKKIIEFHGGDIKVNSQNNVNSFEIILPLVKSKKIIKKFSNQQYAKHI